VQQVQQAQQEMQQVATDSVQIRVCEGGVLGERVGVVALLRCLRQPRHNPVVCICSKYE